jgi:hypothetical protein
MKASEVIKALQKAIEENGDLEVNIAVRDYYTTVDRLAVIVHPWVVNVWHGLGQFCIVSYLKDEKDYNKNGVVIKHPKITYRK